MEEREISDRIHALVRQGVDYCRDASLLEGKGERALRQHTIIMRQCLERRPIREVAKALGISYHHCYRERASICRRVARFICEYNGAPTLDYLDDLDEFRLLMDRTERRAASGDRNAAFQECDHLVLVAPSAPQKIEALRFSSSISLNFGDIDQAKRALATASALREQQRVIESTLPWVMAQSCIDLMESELAYYASNIDEALGCAHRARSQLEQLPTDASLHVKELYVESLLEIAAILWNIGKLESAYEHISSAEANLRYVRATSRRDRVPARGV
jgi:tetratricopeptide (TPR) repeat protein